MTQDRARAGAAAEMLASAYLRRRGLTVRASNYRVRGGEIDLVCDDAGTLVFVEVRLRRNRNFGGAGGSITAAKQRRIVLAAQHYLAGKSERPCRFDVVLLDDIDPARIEWIRGAFAGE